MENVTFDCCLTWPADLPLYKAFPKKNSIRPISPIVSKALCWCSSSSRIVRNPSNRTARMSRRTFRKYWTISCGPIGSSPRIVANNEMPSRNRRSKQTVGRNSNQGNGRRNGGSSIGDSSVAEERSEESSKNKWQLISFLPLINTANKYPSDSSIAKCPRWF